MALRTVIGKLTEGELTRWRALCARQEGVEKNPRVYSKEDTEAVVLSYYRMCDEIARAYDIDDSRNWKVSPFTGVIYYEED